MVCKLCNNSFTVFRLLVSLRSHEWKNQQKTPICRYAYENRVEGGYNELVLVTIPLDRAQMLFNEPAVWHPTCSLNYGSK